MSAYLLPIADREPLAWILSEQRTAFPAHRAAEARRLAPADRLFLYATRGCFRDPTRDRGRVIASARVLEAAIELHEPAVFGGRSYPIGVRLEVESLASRADGVELAPLVHGLHAFPDPRSWSARMRRALVPLDQHDADLIAGRLAAVAQPYPRRLGSYAA